MVEPPALYTPRLRGVLHQWAFLTSLPLGLGLVVAAADARARIAVTVYALTSRRCLAQARCITAFIGVR